MRQCKSDYVFLLSPMTKMAVIPMYYVKTLKTRQVHRLWCSGALVFSFEMLIRPIDPTVSCMW